MNMDLLNSQKETAEPSGLRLVHEAREPQKFPTIEKQFVNFMFLRVSPEIREEQEWDEEQQHGDDEYDDHPYCPDAPYEVAETGSLYAFDVFHSFQSMGAMPLLSSQALVFEKCLQPKNPLSAEKGEG